jgi:capsular exopolysaccharide synthesis family protein
MAQAGLRVVVVDADLRRPSQQKLFHLADKPGQTGLTDLMLQPPGPLSLNGEVQATDVPNLAVITSGPLPPNPSELLGSQRMQSLLNQLREQFDVVIVDTAPLLPVTDALVLSAVVDGVMLVVDADATRAGATSQARQQLEQAGARVIGVVMNKLTARRGGYHYSYYYHYYAAGSEGGKRQTRQPGSVIAARSSAAAASAADKGKA